MTPAADKNSQKQQLPANRRLHDLLHLQQIDFQVLKLVTYMYSIRTNSRSERLHKVESVSHGSVCLFLDTVG